MSARHSPTTSQDSITSNDAQSVIAAKRSELQALWDEISASQLHSSAGLQPTTSDDRTSRLHRLISELQSIGRERPPSYIDRLPDDLLYRVFLLIVSPLPLDLDTIDAYGTLRATMFNLSSGHWQGDASLVLSAVCKRWKAIMLSSPSMWSSPIIDAKCFELEYLQLYLHLSRDHPLTLYFSAPNEELLLALKTHVHRIRRLYFATGASHQWKVDILSDGVTMVLDHPGCDTALCIPISSILSLGLKIESVPLEPICHLQYLQSLSIDGTLPPIPNHIPLPHLRTLSGRWVRPEGLEIWLKQLLVPTLQVLHLFFGEISSEDFTSLQSCISQLPSLITVGLKIIPDARWVEKPTPPEFVSSTIQQVKLEWLWLGGGHTPFDFVAGITQLERLSLRDLGSGYSSSRYCLPVTLREPDLHLNAESTQGMQEISLPLLEKFKLIAHFHYGDELFRNLIAPSLMGLHFTQPPVLVKQISSTAAAFTHTSKLQHLAIGGGLLWSFEDSENVPSFPQLQALSFETDDWRTLVLLEAPQLTELTVEIKGEKLVNHHSPCLKLNYTETVRLALEIDMDRAQSDPTQNTASPVKNLVSSHIFHKLTSISFYSSLYLFSSQGHGFRKFRLPDGFDAVLDMIPSLQRILLPFGHFSSTSDESPIDQLTRRLLEQPSLCSNLQDIGSPQYPTDWTAFLRMLTVRCITSLSSSTSHPRSIHTLHFPLLPHPDIVRQLENAMDCSQVTLHYNIPPCEEQCIYSQGILSPDGSTHPQSKVCFMCHRGRLEKGCPYAGQQGRYACMRWEKVFESWSDEPWVIMPVSMP